MTQEEKILLLAALFHDIGKFEQRCTYEKTKHEQLGHRFVKSFADEFTKILGDRESFEKMSNIILQHHTDDSTNILLKITKEADHLSASERVEFDEPNADLFDKWSHKFLSSLFSKIYLNNPGGKNLRYYEQKVLTRKDHKILIPEYDNENDIKETGHKYSSKDFEEFKGQIKTILDFYKSESDFNSLINLLLILFEKYLWCIPDFTGSSETDISLYNHSKDVAGLAHAILKTKEEKLNLIIGDLPGIQNYIFNVANKKPAKVLRGRSIFVQILTRQFASIFLESLGYTDANLIMLAGGKFYIITDNSDDFENRFNFAKKTIDKYLIDNFNYQLSFSCIYDSFKYIELKNKTITFGDLIDKASYKLLEKRNQQFESQLFPRGNFDENKFILDINYIKPDANSITDKIKCAVTDIPIRNGRKALIEGEQVDKQVRNEFLVGEKITKSNLIIEFSDDYSEVMNVKNLNEFEKNKASKKFILNPNLEELLKRENIEKDILRNAQILEVANYTSKDESNDNFVMDFEEMERKNNGAEYMTLIKGDIDNLGLIMSYGLVDDNFNYTAISRTTTLSNHLKYFFSFSLNGFLEDWENGNVKKAVDDKFIHDQKVYTVFAGGDDLMLICPQSSSLKLLVAFNKTFTDFVCNNPEVHISYSLTNFKHNTPIRIVSEISEDNQKEIKRKMMNPNILSEIDTNLNVFHYSNDKASARIFGTNLKNDVISEVVSNSEQLAKWEEDENNPVTQGVIRNLFYFAKILKDFEEKNDTRLIIWHPKLTYMINRLLKDKNGNYKNTEIKDFFDLSLKINKDNTEAKKLASILFPLTCQTIYRTRKKKEKK